MNPDLIIGGALGVGSVVAGFYAVRQWEAIKARLVARWGTANRNAEEQAIGRLALVTLRAFGPDLKDLKAHLARIEERIDEIEGCRCAPIGADSDLHQDLKMGPPENNAADENWKAKVREAAGWDWKTDKEVLQMARDLRVYLESQKVKKRDAEELVTRVMDEHAAPGCKFEDLFKVATRRAA